MVYRPRPSDSVWARVHGMAQRLIVEPAAQESQAMKYPARETQVKNMADEKKGRQPDFRIVQTDQDKDGKTQFKNVGAIWMNEGGKSAGVVKIGDLRLVLFKNEPRK